MPKSKKTVQDMPKSKKTGDRPTSARLLPNRPLDPKTDEVDVLFAPPEQAVRPNAVQNNRILATYVGLGLERDKDGEALVHLDFSFPLDDSHDGLLPARIREAYDWIKSTENKSAQVLGIPAQTIRIFLDPKDKATELKLVGATISKAVVSMIEEVGKGKAVRVIRFLFRALVERREAVIQWGAWHDGADFWITLENTQKELGE